MKSLYCFIAVLWLLAVLVSSKDDFHIGIKPHIMQPPFAEKPFALMWNVNNTDCPLEDLLDRFGFLHNQGFDLGKSDNISIFYQKKDFPSLPYFDRETGEPVNGGLPQNGSLIDVTTHFGQKVEKMVKGFHGLGVIDWESWRALFTRNNGTEYHNKSLESVRRRFPNWTEGQQFKLARYEFETATRSLMKSVLEVAKLARPGGHWGFYLYPDCRYYDAAAKNYWCPRAEKWRNDEIQWLFDSSTALFPSVYFPKSFQDQDYAVEYVAGRIREAMRADARRPCRESIPVFSYHMPSYKKDSEYLNVYDLIDSIGVASVLGGSGVIIWGGESFVNTPAKCQKMHDYLETVLGPFCAKMASKALKCSVDHCSGHGRCVVSRRCPREEACYLTEAEAVALVKEFRNEAYNIYEAFLLASPEDDGPMLRCQCYPGWFGRHCEWHH